MYNIYLCGPTVYNYPHLGNLRPVIILDFLLRAFKSLNKNFYYVQNITDIDDKIIERAIIENVTEKEIASKYLKNYLKILKNLNVIMPNEMPTVSSNMSNIIDFIKILIHRKAAYVVNGNVYFNIKSTKGYGNISNQKLDKVTLEYSKEKINSQDFALWKNTNKGITWNSPWSEGRPGWHTECATFINKYFNSKTLDIHAGGIDLKFPHHENENIQYLAVNNRKLSNNWYHFGHLLVEKEKMSKSLGNTLSADKFISQYGANLFRIIFLLTNPMSPMSINEQLIKDAGKIENKLAKIAHLKTNYITNDNTFANHIIDFNFAKAMSFLHKQLKEFNKNNNEAIKILQGIINIIGLTYTNNLISPSNKLLLDKWQKLKEQKKYSEADKLRKILRKMNIIN